MENYLSNWIWTPNWQEKDNLTTKLVYFRKTITINSIPDYFNVKISADSRYKLYVNGKIVEVGPIKGDTSVWYYDQKDLVPFLKIGKNVIAVEVLRYPVKASIGNRSICRTQTPGLYVSAEYVTSNKKQVIRGDDSWKCYINDFFSIKPENTDHSRLWFYEATKGNSEVFDWKFDDFDDSAWKNARPYSIIEINKAESPGNLQPRTIPYTIQKVSRFYHLSKIKCSHFLVNDWENFLQGNHSLTIPAYSTEIIDIDAGELMNGFINLSVSGGLNSHIKLLYSECYAYPNPNGGLPIKKDRLDTENGELFGYEDSYTVGGYGSSCHNEFYEPFWFRTFRFIRLEIQTFDNDLTLENFSYRETGYPLNVKTHAETSDASFQKIWDISERTLRRCMIETYMDCPFYEQLQYIMDSRSQALYTYAISGDDRLARQCLDDFKRSQRYDGLLNACYPSVKTTVIPAFSIYYILMLSDHMMYFGDKKLIKEHFPTVERILNFFTNHLNERGLVENIGGELIKDSYWSFIDWTPQWNQTAGVPTAIKKGPLTIETLLFILGLQTAAKLAEFIEDNYQAQVYLTLANDLKQAVNRYCVDDNGIYLDGPQVKEYSQHTQVFAILTETVESKRGAELLKLALENDIFAPCSVAMMYYVFRALEKVNLYKKIDQLWDIWRDMLDNHLTTCVEDDVNARSDCHAWGALILYELPAAILGVHPLEPGFKKVEISPNSGNLKWAKGEVVTPHGQIKVSWKLGTDGKISKIDYQAPDAIEVILRK